LKGLVAAAGSPNLVELRDIPEAAPLPFEALVEVRAISINRGELHRLMSAEDGWHPGWDVAGIVARPAADGSGPAAGTRVLGLKLFGGWAERVAIPTDQLAEIPDEVGVTAAATLPIAGITGLRCLRLGGMLLGKRVLVTGAAGGVGRFVIQLAAASGAITTAVIGSRARGAGLLELGAAEVILEPDVSGHYDLVLDAAGGPSLARSLNAIAPRGLVVSYGNSSRERTEFLVNEFYAKRARLQGYFVLDDVKVAPAGKDLAYLLGLVASRRLQPQIAFEARWEDAGAALSRLRDRTLAGKAVLTVS
jgi:NADPH:quinone reductase-like Zn-dependent oxidoreductase